LMCVRHFITRHAYLHYWKQAQPCKIEIDLCHNETNDK
jgi:hypothetical protein